jgi:hypothetical protein
MKAGRFEHVGAQFFPGITLCENRVPQRSRIKAPFFSVPNFENQFHVI